MNPDLATALTHILVVLVAAKLAAEVAERVGVPAVVGEILAGILIGKSVLDLVGGDDVLRTLGELGVILLLLEVGLEMDLAELGRVGRASMLVATVGVICPMVLGLGAMEIVGTDFKTSLFVASALTATSVGITARVFGDLRALATTEARIVLGAAVADDVMGLVVLTVVVRVVTQGSVSFLSVAGIVAVAIGFLAVSGLVGLRFAPPLFAAVERLSRSTGTLVALALAFTLAFATLADAAKLAPIVGAFVAGLALARSHQSDRIRRELAPVGHLFIPVFFLQIGIDADIGAFTRATVLRDAGILLVVAVAGKLVSPLGAAGVRADKLLIGLGMLPRGEVGLIFATIGLQSGVLSPDLYASLLVVVLVTTLATPQLLRWRYDRLRAAEQPVIADRGDPQPIGGWLEVRDGEVVLLARPPSHLGLTIALEAAVLVTNARPSAGLLDWLSSLGEVRTEWTSRATAALLHVLTAGNARSWRFLDTLGTLEQVLPELSEALRSRQADPFELDPTRAHQWTTIERLLERTETGRLAAERGRLAHPERLLLAALLVEVLEGRADCVAITRRLVGRIGLGAAAEQEAALLVGDDGLLWAMAARAEALDEEPVLQLAAHLESPETARAAYLLAIARGAGREAVGEERLTALHDLVQRVLADPALVGREARNLMSQRRAEARRLVGDDQGAVDRIERAPRAFVLAQPADTFARQVVLLNRVDNKRSVAAETTLDADRDGYWLDIATRDRRGLLAIVTGLLAEAGHDVMRAVVATWPDGMALESFVVAGPAVPDADALARAIAARAGDALTSAGVAGADVSFDDGASPWHTRCGVRAPDSPGLLHALAIAFAAADVDVHAARITCEAGTAVDTFEVTAANGAKLDPSTRDLVTTFIRLGVATRPRRWPWSSRVAGIASGSE